MIIKKFGFLRRIRIPSFFKKKAVQSTETPEKKGIKFCEREASKGAFGNILGKDLLEKIGFNK